MDLTNAYARTLLLLGYLGLVPAMINPVASFAAELLPFPDQERPSPYQQQLTKPQPNISGRQQEQFRQDIAKISCPELRTLSTRIHKQNDTAVTEADREYYTSFLHELNRELSERCNK